MLIIFWIYLGINLAAIIAVLVYAAYKLARDNNFDEHTTIAEYNLPEDLRPIEVGMLIDNELHGRDMSAEIMQLCHEGYIQIEPEGKDYRITKLKEIDKSLHLFDKHLLSFLLPLGDTNLVSMIQADSSAYFDYLKKAITDELVKNGYYGESASNILKFKKNPMTYIVALGFGLGAFTGVGFADQFLLHDSFRSLSDSALVMMFIFGCLGTLAVIPAVAVMFFVFNFIRPKIIPLTHDGRLTQRQLLGFKHYLNVVEMSKLDYEYKPKEDMVRMSKVLPYAVALGCDKNWVKGYQKLYGVVPEDMSNFMEFNRLFGDVLGEMAGFYENKIFDKIGVNGKNL